MKLLLPLYLAATVSALAAGPATNAAPLHPDLPKTNGTTLEGTPAPNAPDHAPLLFAKMEPPTKPAAPEVTLDSYLKALTTDLNLSAPDAAVVKGYYLTDGPLMEKVLNDPSMSPKQQNDQIEEIRDERNSKIETLLEDSDRQAKFLALEAEYRVALVELAAETGFLPPAPAPAPATASPAPTTNAASTNAPAAMAPAAAPAAKPAAPAAK